MRLRRMFLPAFVATAYVIAVGCRYDWTYVEDDGEGGSKDAASGEGGSSDGSSGDTKPIETDASPPPPLPPECSAGTKCATGSWCDFGDGKCGKSATTGKCQVHSGTPCEPQTACSCGGGVMDQCLAHEKGFDTDLTWTTCGTIDTFKCGTTAVTTCKRGLQFCYAKTSAGSGSCFDIKACAGGCSCPEVKSMTVGSCTCDDTKEPGMAYITCP